MIAGFVGFIIPKSLVELKIWKFNKLFVNFLDPFFVGMLFSFIFAIIGSKLCPVTKVEINYREKLLVLPEEEKILLEYKRDKKYVYLLIVVGILVIIFLLFAWAFPYNGLM